MVCSKMKSLLSTIVVDIISDLVPSLCSITDHILVGMLIHLLNDIHYMHYAFMEEK